ncbi:S-adenosyl-L-methionine-dependent methyltransferase [Gloeopeniophorella convolvens]|nr:S-adenosyl-L-methionine-dependent methyltransferase [Gloeopeniophorella convolvens]
MPSLSNSLSRYFLNEGTSEVIRLNSQYLWFKTVWDHPGLLPPEIDAAYVSRVLDAGTGTGAWALDFVSLPDVRDRDVEVFACDISTAKFPQADVSEVKRIRFFEHDVTRPFSEDMLGTFDLVNLSHLGYALTREGWAITLKNVRDLLRPGGHLILRDSDLVMYNEETPPPPADQPHDIPALMHAPSPIANFNRIFAGAALQRDLVVGLSQHLPRFLDDASLLTRSSRRASVPFGNYCDRFKARNGTSLSGFKAFSLEDFGQLFNMIEEQRQALLTDLNLSAAEGGIAVLIEWVIMKP